MEPTKKHNTPVSNDSRAPYPQYSENSLLGLPAEIRTTIWKYIVSSPWTARRWAGALQTCRQMSDEIRYEAYHKPQFFAERNWNLDQLSSSKQYEPLYNLDQWTLPSGLMGKLHFDFDVEFEYLGLLESTDPRHSVIEKTWDRRLEQLLRMELDELVVYMWDGYLYDSTEALVMQILRQEVHCTQVEFIVKEGSPPFKLTVNLLVQHSSPDPQTLSPWAKPAIYSLFTDRPPITDRQAARYDQQSVGGDASSPIPRLSRILQRSGWGDMDASPCERVQRGIHISWSRKVLGKPNFISKYSQLTDS